MNEFLLTVLLIWCKSASASTNNVITAVADETSAPEGYHKVHNLVLNPDKDAWCVLKHIRQIVTHAHCTSKEMENYVCVGGCFSYSVPLTEPETPGDELLDHCDSCQPAHSHWTMVSLDCERDGLEYQVTKNIQMITDCTCATCNSARKPPPMDNEVTARPEQRISELFYKMLPDSHQGDPVVDPKDDLRFSEMSLNDLKKEMKLNPDQELLLSGKLLVKDVASFTADNEEEENIERGFSSVRR